jgi:hypothetical protein
LIVTASDPAEPWSGKEERIAAEELTEPPADEVLLLVRSNGLKLSFHFGVAINTLSCLAEGVDGSILSTERAGGFVGTV